MKKLLSLFLAVVMLCSLFTVGVSAAEIKEEKTSSTRYTSGDFEYIVDNGNATIMKYTGKEENLIIPSTIDGYPVTKIGFQSFSNCEEVISVSIPDSVKEIGKLSFYSCGKLKEIVIPDSVTTIGESAFSYCYSLTKITMGKNVKNVGFYVFEYCINLEEVYITDIIAWLKIGYRESGNPLYYADKLYVNGEEPTELVIPGEVTDIPAYAFEGCSSLKSVTILPGVKTIANHAFKRCSNLTEISIPDTVTSICGTAFFETGYYNDSKNWENDVLYIDNHLINAKYTLSGDYVIREGTKTIGNYAFFDCKSLTSITIPASLVGIGKQAFENCESIANVYISDLKAWLNMEFYNKDFYSLPATTIFSYNYNLYLNNELVTDVVIPKGITGIYAANFANCKSLISIIIENDVTAIGPQAFNNCINLKNITISDKIQKIYYRAFNGTAYYNDENNWEDGVLYLGSFLINTKSDMPEKCIIKEGTKVIVEMTFYYNSKITDLVIPDSVEIIEESAFADCVNLKNVTLGKGLKVSELRAFNYCHKLENVYISDLDKYWDIEFGGGGGNPLEYADNLYVNGELVTDIIVPEGIDVLNKNIWTEFAGIKSVTFPEGLRKISSSAFWSCKNLSKVTLPDTIESIGSSAFLSCTSLMSVEIPESVKEIQSMAFGYYFDYDQQDYLKYKGFQIIGVAGSVAEDYALSNGIEFIYKESPIESSSTTSDATTEPTESSSATLDNTTESTETTATEEKETPNISIAGEFNFWTPEKMKIENKVAIITLELSAGTYEFKIVEDDKWLTNFGIIEDTTTLTSESGWQMFETLGLNCKLKASGGLYTFEYNYETDLLKVLFTPNQTVTTEPTESTSETVNNTTDPTESTSETVNNTTESTEDTSATTDDTTKPTESSSVTTDSTTESTEITTADPDISIAGTFNIWRPEKMRRSGKYALITLELSEDVYEFKIIENDVWYGSDNIFENKTAEISANGLKMSEDSYNCQLKASGGRYTFIYNYEQDILTVLYATDETATTKPSETVVTDPTEGTPPTESTTVSKKTTVTLKNKVETLYLSDSTKIKADVKNGVGKTQFKSEDTSIATVSAKGKVTAKKVGTVKIKVTNNGVTRIFKVKVKKPTLNKDKITLNVGESFKLKIVGQVGRAIFESNKKKNATVNSKGKIIGLKKGNVIITVKTNGIKLKCKVKIK